MSFGEGNLHERVEQLDRELAEALDMWSAQAATIKAQFERIRQLERLVLDMYTEWCATVDDYYAGNLTRYYERMAALGLTEGADE